VKRIGVAIAAAASVVWLAWPYLSAYSTAQAINDGDTVALETRISWPAVPAFRHAQAGELRKLEAN
jgi:hypothetical protein